MALSFTTKPITSVPAKPAVEAPYQPPFQEPDAAPPTVGYTPKAKRPSPTVKAPAPTEAEDEAYERQAKKVQVQSSPTGRKAHKNKVKAKPLTKGDLDLMLAATDTPLAEITPGGSPTEDDLEYDPDAPSGRRPRATAEALEYRRKQIMRLVIRGVPKQTIATHLGLSIKQVYADMVEINKEVRYELTNFDYQGYIGMSLAFYEECRNIALRLATDTKEKSNSVKMQAINAALKAEDSKHEFLTKVGLFKVTSPTDPFASINTGRQGSYSDQNDTNDFLQSIAQAREKYMGKAQEVITPTEGGNQ
jgi:DNA-binding CsgD family transcriptional regulator